MPKDFRSDTWETFNKCVKNKKLYIWGAGKNGEFVAQNILHYSSDWKVGGFIDKDERKTECVGFPVYRPEVLAKENKAATAVLISVAKPQRIAESLEGMGIKDYFSFFWLNTPMKDYRLQTDLDYEKLAEVKKLLADDESKEILSAVIKKREIGFMDYTDITSEGTEYFIDEFFSPKNDEVFIDGGAFDGDTIEEFVDWTKNKYSAIYSFEPDKRMFGMIQEKLHRWHDVTVYNNGLYSKEKTLPFKIDNVVYSSKIDWSAQAQNKWGGGRDTLCFVG